MRVCGSRACPEQVGPGAEPVDRAVEPLVGAVHVGVGDKDAEDGHDREQAERGAEAAAAARATDPDERHERRQRRDPAEQEQRAVAARRLDRQAGHRERDRRGDRADREVQRRVRAGLALRDQGREEREAEGRDQPEARRAEDERAADGDEARRGADAEEAAAEQGDPDEQQRAMERRVLHAAGEDDPHAGCEPEPREPERRDARPEPELVFRIEEEERGKGGVAEHPEDLREQEAADAGAERRAEVVRSRVPRSSSRHRRVTLGLRHATDRRQGEQRDEHGGEREGRPDGEAGERASDGEAEQAAHEHRELLGARRLGATGGVEGFRDQRAVRRGDGVQADVDDGSGERQHEVRARRAERDRDQAACGDERAAEDERHPATTAAACEPVAPDPDDQRHGHPGRGVDEHDHPDQAGRVVDPLEHERQVARRDRAAEAGGERGGREGDDVREPKEGEAGGAAESDAGHAAAPTMSSACGAIESWTVSPTFVVSAITGERPPVAILIVRARVCVTPGRPRCVPRRRRGARPSSARRPPSIVTTSSSPSRGSAGATRRPGPKSGMFATKSWPMRTRPQPPSSENAIVNGSKRATAPRPARMPARTSAEFVAV